MRRLFIILMIVLLPLRSWAGDLMAVSMSAHAVAVASSPVVAKHAAVDAKDCADHVAPFVETADSGAADDGHCKTCVTCQICHSALLLSVATVATSAPGASHLKPPVAAGFASAQLANSVKPPIS